MNNNNYEKNKKFASSECKSLAPNYFEDYQKKSLLLRNVIDGGQATNIGIVSKFGGGKSSFIKTFIKDNKNFKTASVSAANIIDKSFESEEIESIIIKQLIYSKKASDLPDSRIKRIGQTPKLWKYILTAVLFSFSIVAFALLSLFIAKPTGENILKYWFENDEKIFLLTEVIILIGGICLIALGASLFLFNIKSFSLKYKDVEITKNNNDSETPFFKYLDELVYFFNETNIQIVFFEDLDRLSGNSIFDKLRELNCILNSSISNKSSKTIVFVYACGDDIFKGKPENKNKYFDFTINLDPILTKENCASIITTNKMFSNLNEWLGDKLFIDRISIYFDEMRVLLSVYNDCLLYVKDLDDSELETVNSIEIFTLMTYRAIFPSEFKKLVEGESGLDNVINIVKETYKTSRPFDYLVSNTQLLNSYIADTKLRDFLVMIIKYGYLSPDFKDYILKTPASISLSKEELEFLRNLNSNKYDKGSYFSKFDSTDRLYSKFGDNDFKDVHILNKYIINDYLDDKFEGVRNTNIQNAFLSKNEKDIDYINDFIISYLAGETKDPKESGDKYNNLFFIKVSKFKPDLLRIILETKKVDDDYKKDLISDYIFALSSNSSLFMSQEKAKDGILLVQNHGRFRNNLIFYDWVIQYCDSNFEKLKIDEIQENDALIKKLVSKNYIILDKHSIYKILESFGQPRDSYLKGHYLYNSSQTIALFNYFNNNIESFVNILKDNNLNQIGINSLTSYCNSNIDKSVIEQLLERREGNAPKMDASANLSPTAIVSGFVNNCFKLVSLQLFSSLISASIAKFKNEYVSSNLILKFVSSDLIDISIKQYANSVLVNKFNCNDDILNKIVSLKLLLDDSCVSNLLTLTTDKDLKVAIACSCSADKKKRLVALIPELDEIYKKLVRDKRIRVVAEQLDMLPGFKLVKSNLDLSVSKYKQYRIIRLNN